MALVTEDGTGRADAESFCTVSFADGYHAARGNDLWGPLLTAEKEAALRRATDYIEATYGLRWIGAAITATQALSWPRYYAARAGLYPYSYWASNAVPILLQRACAELAFRAASDDLAPDQGRLTRREKVDVIEVEYADNQPAITQYRAVDDMLAPLLGGDGRGGLARLLVRA